jgi:ribosomal protein S18 acetylase RimI-like enzyme
MKIYLNSATGTDLIYYMQDGSLIDRKNYSVIKTPSNPISFRANQLVLNKEPQSIQEALRIFHNEFQDVPKVKHITITWDTESVIKADFLELHGLKYSSSYVLRLENKNRDVFNNNISCKEASSTEEWDFIVKSQIPKGQETNPAIYKFFIDHFKTQQDLVKQGKALWLIATDGKQCLGSLGVMFREDVARFQAVKTDSNFRGRGVCSSLIKHAVNKLGQINTFIMVTDNEHADALRLYQKHGFVISGLQHTLYKWN